MTLSSMIKHAAAAMTLMLCVLFSSPDTSAQHLSSTGHSATFLAADPSLTAVLTHLGAIEVTPEPSDINGWVYTVDCDYLFELMNIAITFSTNCYASWVAATSPAEKEAAYDCYLYSEAVSILLANMQSEAGCPDD